MAANRYDNPSPYGYVSQYVPIPFQEMVELGKYYAAERRAAEEQLSSSIQKFGKFRSPSEIDTQNYYKESIGKFAPLIEQAAANPELMKTAAFRAQLQNAYNTVDYTTLSMLEESANNLRAGLEMRAKMKAEGLYNKNWDRSDIPNYDTLRSKEVFSDITPVKYMTANELSNKYFDNLKAGDLGPVWRDGIKYRAIGNSVEDLEKIYDTYENDLINSPQGREYMRQFIADNNGDVNAARSDFRSMILASQMDRTIRPNLQVDQGWLMQQKIKIARGIGDTDMSHVAPTRQQQMRSDIANTVIGKVSKLPAEAEKHQNIHTLAAQGYADEYLKAKAAYEKSGSDSDFIYMNQMYSKAQQEAMTARSYLIKHLMMDAFNKTANFELYNDPKSNKRYNRAGYVAGAKSAISAISNTTSLHNISDGGDPLITLLGGTPQQYTTKSGSISNVYQFENSANFMLPESVLQLATGTQPAEAERYGGMFRDTSFGFRQALEQGALQGVQFIPNTSNNTFEIGGANNESHMFITGKLRIPAKEIENKLGTGMWTGTGLDMIFMPAGRTSAADMLKNQYNASEIQYGDDGDKYFEIDASYMLPSNSDDDYWYDVNQLRENSPSSGGVGGATQAEKQRIATLQSLMLD